MRLILGVCLVIALGLSGTASTQDPFRIKLQRDDFLREILSTQPDRRTRWYDATVPGSYTVDKIDVLRGLPDAAGTRGINLRGLLLIGPDGPLSVYYVYAFWNERGTVRVNELTVAMSRISYKSTNTMAETQFRGFWGGLLGANVTQPGLPSKMESDAATESSFDLLLASWSGGKPETFYGSIAAPPPGAKIEEFQKLIGKLLRSLSKTHPTLAPLP